eukprot:jgi/Botrbrau1/7112/Bobra.0165s0129.1
MLAVGRNVDLTLPNLLFAATVSFAYSAATGCHLNGGSCKPCLKAKHYRRQYRRPSTIGDSILCLLSAATRCH